MAIQEPVNRTSSLMPNIAHNYLLFLPGEDPGLQHILFCTSGLLVCLIFVLIYGFTITVVLHNEKKRGKYILYHRTVYTVQPIKSAEPMLSDDLPCNSL